MTKEVEAGEMKKTKYTIRDIVEMKSKYCYYALHYQDSEKSQISVWEKHFY